MYLISLHLFQKLCLEYSYVAIYFAATYDMCAYVDHTECHFHGNYKIVDPPSQNYTYMQSVVYTYVSCAEN